MPIHEESDLWMPMTNQSGKSARMPRGLASVEPATIWDRKTRTRIPNPLAGQPTARKTTTRRAERRPDHVATPRPIQPRKPAEFKLLPGPDGVMRKYVHPNYQTHSVPEPESKRLQDGMAEKRAKS